MHSYSDGYENIYTKKHRELGKKIITMSYHIKGGEKIESDMNQEERKGGGGGGGS